MHVPNNEIVVWNMRGLVLWYLPALFDVCVCKVPTRFELDHIKSC